MRPNTINLKYGQMLNVPNKCYELKLDWLNIAFGHDTTEKMYAVVRYERDGLILISVSDNEREYKNIFECYTHLTTCETTLKITFNLGYCRIYLNDIEFTINY